MSEFCRKFSDTPSRASSAAFTASRSPNTIVVWFRKHTLIPAAPSGYTELFRTTNGFVLSFVNFAMIVPV